jgi:signal transduction histidine kinase
LIVRPVRALIRQTQAIAAGQAEGAAALAHAGTHEIAQLSQAFAHMATRLRERAAYIQGFAASVSHEFKTPLTAMQGTAELLRDHGAEMAPGERERFFADLVADTERLSRLVHRVLELARADMLEPGDEVTSPGEVMAAVAEGCRQAGMPVATAGLERGGLVRMNAETLETILRQLAENARVHGGAGVALTLALDWQAAPPAAVIEVADDGPGISPANRGRIFEPFFTTNRDHGGTGMGLHIARALLHSHGGAIELLPSERGARFRLTIPA